MIPSQTTLLAAALLAASPGRAEDPAEAARRVADTFASQLAARQQPAAALALAPLEANAGARSSASLSAFHEALFASLSRRKLTVRDWAALDQASREQALAAAAGRPGPRPAPLAVQALVVGEALAGADPAAPLRVTLRLVAVPSGAVLAAEAVTLPGGGPAPAAGADAGQRVDVAVRRLADQLAAGFQKLPEARYQRLAVLDFAETGAEARRRELGAVVSAELATCLRRDHGLLLVERSRLTQVLGEMRLGAMGLVEPAQAPRLGRMLEAQALVLGSVADAGDRFLLNARVVVTETSDTVAAAAQPVSAGSLVALSSEAVVLRSRKDALFRSLLVPGWGQFYNRQPVKGALLLGGEVALLGGATAFHLLGSSAEDRYRRASDSATAIAERGRSEDRYRVRNGLLIGAAALWAYNVADAYFSGVDGDQLAVAPLPGGAALAVAGRF